MDQSARIYVAGHRGLVGSALVRRLGAGGWTNIITRSHRELDLCDHSATTAFFEEEQPEYVFLAAARVGGILANQTYPADFISTNLLIQTSVIGAAQRSSVRRLIFFGSGCAYPRDCPQPMREEYLLTGRVEPSSEPYAISKIAGMKLCEAFNAQYGTEFISVIPATLYGPQDNFDPGSAHVLSALLRRCHTARDAAAERGKRSGPMVIWGTGTPLREFLYVDDLADACILLAGLDRAALTEQIGAPGLVVNVGSDQEVSIRGLAALIAETVGLQADFIQDVTKPDGAPRKLLDSRIVRGLGWTPQVSLSEGIRRTYAWYRSAAAGQLSAKRTGG